MVARTMIKRNLKRPRKLSSRSLTRRIRSLTTNCVSHIYPNLALKSCVVGSTESTLRMIDLKQKTETKLPF